jgi:hypothetical protein
MTIDASNVTSLDLANQAFERRCLTDEVTCIVLLRDGIDVIEF